MPVDLTIDFGGLCMFVERANARRPGLYVLMPNTAMHRERHWPVIVVPQKFTDTNTAILYPLFGQEIDIYNIVPPLPSPGQDFSWALNVSEYTRGTPVDDQWLTVPPHGPLAARVRLPVNVTVTPDGDVGEISIENGPKDHKVRGIAKVRLRIDLPTPSLQFGDAQLIPFGDSIEVHVLNIRLCDLVQQQRKRKHWKGQEVDHQQAYYSLLSGSPSKGPKFTVGTNAGSGTEIGLCEEVQCPMAPTAVRDFNRWVDTHDCTLGTGT